MPIKGTKMQEMKHVSFRMPIEAYQDYAMVAETRGIDLSALLNWVTAEYRPVLLLRQAEYKAGMLRAAMLGLSPHSVVGPQPQDALDRLNALIGTLQDAAMKLATQIDGAKSAA